jgi:hypothetical protein
VKILEKYGETVAEGKKVQDFPVGIQPAEQSYAMALLTSPQLHRSFKFIFGLEKSFSY